MAESWRLRSSWCLGGRPFQRPVKRKQNAPRGVRPGEPGSLVWHNAKRLRRIVASLPPSALRTALQDRLVHEELVIQRATEEDVRPLPRRSAGKSWRLGAGGSVPRALPRKSRFADKDIVINVMGIAVDVGGRAYTFPAGTRLRASHPAVRASEWCWHKADGPVDDLPPFLAGMPSRGNQSRTSRETLGSSSESPTSRSTS